MVLWTNAGNWTAAWVVFFYCTFPSLIINLFSIQFIRLISRILIFTVWEIRVQSSFCKLTICLGIVLELCNGTGWKCSWFSGFPSAMWHLNQKYNRVLKPSEQVKPPTQPYFLRISFYFECHTALQMPYQFFHWRDRFLKCIIWLRAHINRKWWSPDFGLLIFIKNRSVPDSERSHCL